MLRNIIKILAVFIIGAVGGIFADQIFWPYFVERPLFHQYRLEQSPVYVTEKKEITIQENTALKNAIEKAEKVIVGVRTETKAGKFIEGSGLIITSDGLIVTLSELAPKGSDFSFFIDGKQTNFQILTRENGLVLIKLEEENLPTASFADLEKLKLGERVFLIGVVFESKKPSKMVNEGIVKSFDKDFIKTNMSEKYTAAGSSLFDIEGNILGLNTINKAGEVIAIPVSKIKSFAGF